MAVLIELIELLASLFAAKRFSQFDRCLFGSVLPNTPPHATIAIIFFQFPSPTHTTRHIITGCPFLGKL
jgi:hypothetical protein